MLVVFGWFGWDFFFLCVCVRKNKVIVYSGIKNEIILWFDCINISLLIWRYMYYVVIIIIFFYNEVYNMNMEYLIIICIYFCDVICSYFILKDFFKILKCWIFDCFIKFNVSYL